MSWQERLAWFDPTCFEHVPPEATGRVVLVRETSNDGQAHVELVVPEGCDGLGLALGGDQTFAFLRDRRHADGHLLVRSADGTWSAHVVECKRTLKEKSWRTARKQICASLLRLEIIAALLGVTVSHRRAWVAFRRDELSASGTTNPVLLKLPVTRAATTPSSPSEARESWEQGQIEVAALDVVVPCGPIGLDDAGRGGRTLPDAEPS